MDVNGTVQLKVAPEVLEARADTVTGLVNTIRSSFDTLSEVMQRTDGYWIGEAADTHRKQYGKMAYEIEEIMRRLGDYPRNMLLMAGIYKEAEDKVATTSQSLPTQVIN